MNLNEYNHVVFGFEHYNPLGIVRTLGEAGLSPIGIIVRNDRKVTSKSKYLKKIYFVDSIEEGYTLLLNKYGKGDKKTFVYASDDQLTNYVDKRYSELKDRFYFYNAGEDSRLAIFQDKANILALANKYGLNYAKTYEVNKGEIPEGLDYPIITKASISTIDNWKDDMFVCNNKQELQEAYKHIKSEKVLIQKYVKKKGELSLEGFAVNNGKDVYFTTTNNDNYALNMTYCPYATIYTFKNQNILGSLRNMFKEVKYDGIFSCDFLVGDDDKLYFLEINFRNSALSYASTIAGMPLPVLWARGMIDPESVKDCVKEIDTPFMSMNEVEDYKTRVKQQGLSTIKWIKDFNNAKCKYYLGRNDPRPLISVITHKIGKVFKKSK